MACGILWHWSCGDFLLVDSSPEGPNDKIRPALVLLYAPMSFGMIVRTLIFDDPNTMRFSSIWGSNNYMALG